MKKILLVYYSRTGTTKKLAEKISAGLACDVEEIFDAVDRSGPGGYILAGRDATLKRLTALKPVKFDPADYDLVIIGTPVWAWNVSTPIRTYLTVNKDKFKSVAFFCTSGGTPGENIFKYMSNITGLNPTTMLDLTTREVINGGFEKRLKEFAGKAIK